MRTLSLLLIFLPGFCFANFSGIWTGSGEVTKSYNQPGNTATYKNQCNGSTFEIKQTEETFVIVEYTMGTDKHGNCDHGFNIFNGLVVRDGKFYSIYYPTGEEIEVGSYNDHLVVIDFSRLPNLVTDYGREQEYWQFELSQNGELKFYSWHKLADGSFESKKTAVLNRK